jgi:hypothetical protein
LRGQGRFFDDLRLADQLYATIVPHADIAAIDTRAALKTPDVLADRGFGAPSRCHCFGCCQR